MNLKSNTLLGLIISLGHNTVKIKKNFLRIVTSGKDKKEYRTTYITWACVETGLVVFLVKKDKKTFL